MRIFEFNDTITTILDFSLWALIHITIGYVLSRMSESHFTRDVWPYRETWLELKGRLYVLLGIKKWKRLLPDGAKLIDRNGFLKRKFESTDINYIKKFIIETRRAELVHLIHFPFLIVFFLFNPLAGDIIMIVYAFFFNVPCLMSQRYNRKRLMKLLETLEKRRKI